MRSALASVANRRAVRQRSTSLSAVPPAESSDDYLPELAATAASIVYRSPLNSAEGRPIYIANAAAFPDTFDVDYDSLLPYVLARLPGEDDLIHGTEYEIVFLAGGQSEGATSEKRQGPGIGWYLQAYHVLSRAMRKRLARLYIVHPRTWVRVLISVFSTVVSPKFRRKIVHISNLSSLGQKLRLEDLLIPPSAYLHDRRLEPEIESENIGRAFGAFHPLPIDLETNQTRLPRVLRETTTFLLMEANVNTEGIFRIPPHSLLAGIVREHYDRGQKFIIWKENGAVFAQPGVDSSLIDEIRLEDAYNVHLAAALIKTWYRELRQPIFQESSYPYLREHFAAPGQEISLQDLVQVYDPASENSCLDATSRETLTRHLIPMLFSVAQSEPKNKMNASNLSIIFSMALVRGSNELEDAKIATSIKLLLEATILQWSALKKALDINDNSFAVDLQIPSNRRLYEDPLDAAPDYAHSSHAQSEDHQITLDDEDEEELPVIEKPGISSMPRRLPVPKTNKDNLPPPVPKRKPTPSKIDSHPPAYSPASETATPLNSSRAASSSSQLSIASTVLPAYEESSPVNIVVLPESLTKVPPRKEIHTATPSPTDHIVQPEIDGQSPTITPDTKPADTAQAEPANSTFRKPSLPASATRMPAKLPSLAKQVFPGTQTLSPIAVPNGMNMAAFPKPRTPSPGLLQRMNSIEAATNIDKSNSPDDERNKYKLTPGKLSLRKASVDDLRRLYEDRLSTIEGLARVEGVKRSNSQS